MKSSAPLLLLLPALTVVSAAPASRAHFARRDYSYDVCFAECAQSGYLRCEYPAEGVRADLTPECLDQIEPECRTTCDAVATSGRPQRNHASFAPSATLHRSSATPYAPGSGKVNNLTKGRSMNVTRLLKPLVGLPATLPSRPTTLLLLPLPPVACHGKEENSLLSSTRTAWKNASEPNSRDVITSTPQTDATLKFNPPASLRK
ncbi:hypothetical protein HK097_011573 [Rhizophlyctis rosea]|uniref:Uncharacterized protein n=1 Tax=Rhizophlyctis rosea TaxID=64517 RepID=A0AAD5S8Q1_9FUNG|nr:hypothetical protein HK097_011573 [Rhizophlyctis rosea]